MPRPRPRNGNIEFEATIKSGLPVIVHADIYPAEPDIGIFFPQVEINGIYWLPKGRNWKKPLRPVPDKLWDEAMVRDREALEILALEAAE